MWRYLILKVAGLQCPALHVALQGCSIPASGWKESEEEEREEESEEEEREEEREEEEREEEERE